jgi:hypothetical protein
VIAVGIRERQQGFVNRIKNLAVTAVMGLKKAGYED